MYDRICKDIKDSYYADHYANDGQRFVAWYIRNILQCDPIQTRQAITDGRDDKQIDAVVIDDDRESVYILQGKFVSEQKLDGTPLREVVSAWLQIKDLEALQANANERLRVKISELSKALEDGYDVHFELLTTGSLTDAARADLESFQKQFADLSASDDIECSLHLVDQDEIQRRYESALSHDTPILTYTLPKSAIQSLEVEISGTKAIVAVMPLPELIKLPGIKDGSLFRKNVRQSLGLSNAVNKGIKNTIYGDKANDFFFFHNGITGICNRIETNGDTITLRGLSIVNGCQSLTTLLSCSERVKGLSGSFMLCRFYEIPQRERADRISINTNSQSAVKARDLRSNDKRVISLKRDFEAKYPDGCFITKRGEEAPATAKDERVVELADFGKFLMAWHSQRPNAAYGETKIFDKYFEQLFRRDYRPEDVYALNRWYRHVMRVWGKDNPLNFNETLLAMRSYAPFHHLYAVSMCFAISSSQTDKVPSPSAAWHKVEALGMHDKIVEIAGISVNMALEAASNEPQPGNRVFSPHNWIKTKTCLSAINAAIRNYYGMLPMMPGGREIKGQLDAALRLDAGHFDYRWAAD